MTPPLDPSIRDPAADALRDSYEEAARAAEGAKPPEGYVVQEPSDIRTTYTFVPVLPDGAPPTSLRDMADTEAAQVYQPVPTPWQDQALEEPATGGSGEEPSEPESPETGAAAQPSTTEGNSIGGRSVVSESNPTRDTVIGGRSVVTGSDTSGGTGGSGPQQQARPPPTPQQQLEQLQTRVQQLEAELKQRNTELQQQDQQLAQESTNIEQHIDQTGGRALQTEQTRQQRLSQIDVAGQWMLAADQALERGEFAVGNAINSADQAFENVRISAASDGQNTVVVHAERARAYLQVARDAVINRDNYAARVALADAGLEIPGMRTPTLPREPTGNVMLNP